MDPAHLIPLTRAVLGRGRRGREPRRLGEGLRVAPGRTALTAPLRLRLHPHKGTRPGLGRLRRAPSANGHPKPGPARGQLTQAQLEPLDKLALKPELYRARARERAVGLAARDEDRLRVPSLLRRMPVTVSRSSRRSLCFTHAVHRRRAAVQSIARGGVGLCSGDDPTGTERFSRSELQRCDEYARQGTVARPQAPRLRARVAIRLSSRRPGRPRPALPARRRGPRIRPPRSRPPRNRSHRARRPRPARRCAQRA